MTEISLLFLFAVLGSVLSTIYKDASLRRQRRRLATVQERFSKALLARYRNAEDAFEASCSAASVAGLLLFPWPAHYLARHLLSWYTGADVLLTPGLELMPIPHMLAGMGIAVIIQMRVFLHRLDRTDPALHEHFAALYAVQHATSARLFSGWVFIPLVFVVPTLGVLNLYTAIDEKGVDTWSASSFFQRARYPLSDVTDLILVEKRKADGRGAGYETFVFLRDGLVLTSNDQFLAAPGRFADFGQRSRRALTRLATLTGKNPFRVVRGPNEPTESAEGLLARLKLQQRRGGA